MSWILLGLASAFFDSLKDVFGKFGLRDADEYVVGFTLCFFSALFTSYTLLDVEISKLPFQFWQVIVVGGLINVLALILYMRAIKIADLSLCIPLIALTPLFLLVTEPLIVGDTPSPQGVLGVVLIVAGSYFLNFHRREGGVFEPFRLLWVEKGPRMMIICAFLWSITSALDKIGIQHSSPMFWVFAVNFAVAVGLLPFLPSRIARLKKRTLLLLIPMGLFNAVALTFQFLAVAMVQVSYVIAMKRLNSLFAVIWGGLFFKEQNLRNRALGAAILLLGVACIAGA